MRQILSLFAAGALIAVPAANAATITYTESAIGSGTFDGRTYTDALVTFSATGTTANVTHNSGTVYLSTLPTTVTVAGLHTDRLTDSIDFVSNQGVGAAGLGDNTTDYAILYTVNTAFETYALITTLGPTTGSNLYDSARAFATSGGSFTLASIDGDSTFQSTLSTAATTPEPSSLLLLATGSLGLAGAVRRRITR